jgi:predicted DNA-binding transcriptional regulator AlpA
MTRPARPAPPTRPVTRPPLAGSHSLRAAVNFEPLLKMCDLARWLNCSRREVERMRSSGRLPRPDLILGRRSPRWRPEKIRAWIESGGRS